VEPVIAVVEERYGSGHGGRLGRLVCLDQFVLDRLPTYIKKRCRSVCLYIKLTIILNYIPVCPVFVIWILPQDGLGDDPGDYWEPFS
jgi:hypothetical protein